MEKERLTRAGCPCEPGPLTKFNNRDETGETGEEKNNIGIPVAYVRNAVTGQRSGHCDIGIVPRVPYFGPGVSSNIFLFGPFCEFRFVLHLI